MCLLTLCASIVNHTPALRSLTPATTAKPRSKLWGCKGELFAVANSTGSQRLLDWSYAGYMAGEMPIPRLPLVASVTEFGAVGDGVADDTQVGAGRALMRRPGLLMCARCCKPGAAGDSLTPSHCDPQAFLDAVDAIGRQGTLLVPAGRYIICRQISINKRVVLRGEVQGRRGG
jgi:hypothetical protein